LLYEAATGRSPRGRVDSGDDNRQDVINELAELGLHPILIRVISDCLPLDPTRRLRAPQVRQELARVRRALLLRETIEGKS
jgi:hypothetical protein